MQRIVKIIIGAIVLLIAARITALCISHQIRKPDTPPRLTILTYNTHQMNYQDKPDSNNIIKELLHSGADIICLQEVDVRKNEKYLTLNDLKNAMRSNYKYTFFDFKIYNKTRQYGNVIFSKYPLINKKTVQYESRANISSFCDCVIGSDTIRLFVNHLESYKYNQKKMDKAPSLVGKMRYVYRLYVAAITRRDKQALALYDELQRSPFPAIIVGDLNSLPFSQVYRTIAKDYTDCFLHGSFGKIGNTFMLTKHIGMRIDYIFTSKNIDTYACWVHHVPYSDHFPLYATLCW